MIVVFQIETDPNLRIIKSFKLMWKYQAQSNELRKYQACSQNIYENNSNKYLEMSKQLGDLESCPKISKQSHQHAHGKPLQMTINLQNLGNDMCPAKKN